LIIVNELVSLLPPAMSLLDAGLLVAASLVTSFISAAFGIGGGFTLIALLALLLPPAALVPVHGIVQLRWAFSSFGRCSPNCHPSSSAIFCLAVLFPAF
jgi:uncharacterized membrane protein YfcA